MNLKEWLRAVYQYVTDLQDYFYEYSFRSNSSTMKKDIIENPHNIKVMAGLYYIKNIGAYLSRPEKILPAANESAYEKRKQ
ncbi:MAG TPA: hypothetical protein DDY13_13750 [Cytophagales bacterium]|jgi:hypothetical protein|nr:hypothetical protein [Cytophagales bacterium]